MKIRTPSGRRRPLSASGAAQAQEYPGLFFRYTKSGNCQGFSRRPHPGRLSGRLPRRPRRQLRIKRLKVEIEGERPRRRKHYVVSDAAHPAARRRFRARSRPTSRSRVRVTAKLTVTPISGSKDKPGKPVAHQGVVGGGGCLGVRLRGRQDECGDRVIFVFPVRIHFHEKATNLPAVLRPHGSGTRKLWSRSGPRAMTYDFAWVCTVCSAAYPIAANVSGFFGKSEPMYKPLEGTVNVKPPILRLTIRRLMDAVLVLGVVLWLAVAAWRVYQDSGGQHHPHLPRPRDRPADAVRP